MSERRISITRYLFDKQTIVLFILGMLVTAAVFALVITWWGYLPTIVAVPFGKEHRWLGAEFSRIARNSFLISGASGLALGLALPVIVRAYIKAFRDRYGKHAA